MDYPGLPLALRSNQAWGCSLSYSQEHMAAERVSRPAAVSPPIIYRVGGVANGPKWLSWWRWWAALSKAGRRRMLTAGSSLSTPTPMLRPQAQVYVCLSALSVALKLVGSRAVMNSPLT